MDLSTIAAELQGRLQSEFPGIEVRLEKWQRDPARVAIYFVDPRFACLYPLQRYHYISHLLPGEYMASRGLADAVWFELAPEEQPDDIKYPDEDLIRDITPDVLAVLRSLRYFEALDDSLCPVEEGKPTKCAGDFSVSKAVLLSKGMSAADFGDVFNVLMFQGAFCDCEVMYNVAEESRLKSQYWRAPCEHLQR